MTLKKKIALSFFISSFIIALLIATEYIKFIDIRKEIRNLQIADTIRSESLQLRRHEKNFFLYPGMADKEAVAVYRNIDEIDVILGNSIAAGRAGGLPQLRRRLAEYRQRFKKIELSITKLSDQLGESRNRYPQFQNIYPLVQLTFREHPLRTEDFLERIFSRPSERRLLEGLRALDPEIQEIRKNGEDILDYANEQDRDARADVDRVIRISQTANLAIFPLVFISGIGTLFLISRNVANRLKLLTGRMEKAGKGQFSPVAFTENSILGYDEVGILMKGFSNMEAQLAQREDEIQRKNEELLQSKKLAAIGTLASGVAHELNNPLNNIYISAQILEKEAEDSCSPIIIDSLHDIIGQTIRVKRIVGDLLEFARGRDLCLVDADLKEIIMGAYKMVSTGADTAYIDFTLDSTPEGLFIHADTEQMERVFINLFTNAVDAMKGLPRQILKTKIAKEGEDVIIIVSDTGRGIPADAVDKIFEPFYSTKDRGTGLGLAIVFNIIKRHDGEIYAESEEGKGTTFFITLPVKRDK